MKKFIIFLIFIGVVSSPIELKKDINIYEDEEIVKKYIEHLEGVNVDDYSPYISNLITNNSDFDSSVINLNTSIDIEFGKLDNINKFEFEESKIENLLNNSKSISTKIEDSILKMYQKEEENINIFIGNKLDLEKLNEFKKEIVDFANEKIVKFDTLTKGQFIENLTKTEVYNNIIEIEFE